MKTKLLVFCFAILVMAVSCNDSDDTLPQDPLEGVWHLKNVSGGIQGLDLDYDRGDVIWDFTTDEGVLKVESTLSTTGPKSIYQGFVSGTYAVGFEEKDTTRTILIKEVKFRVSEIDQTKSLILDDGAVVNDGFIRSFVR